MISAECTAVAARRRGMTLVELLVVTGLIAVFLGLLVVGGRRKGGIEPLPSVLATVQGRALGVPEGAAVILEPGSGPESNANKACTSIYEATMLPLIDATVTGTLDSANGTRPSWPSVAVPPTGTMTSGPSIATFTLTSATVELQTTSGEEPSRAYKLMLSGTEAGPAGLMSSPSSPWFQWALQSWGTVTGTGVLSFRGDIGQSTNNTIWPKPPTSGTFNAVLAQYPVKSSAMVAMGEGMAIDLRFSGIGDDRSTAYGRLDENDKPDPKDPQKKESKGAIAVVFDRVGRVAEVIQQVPDPGVVASGTTAQPAIPSGTLYFLVVPRDQIVSSTNSNTLSSPDAKWVAIAPQTGRVSVADNVAQTGTDTAALRNARAKVRAGIELNK